MRSVVLFSVVLAGCSAMTEAPDAANDAGNPVDSGVVVDAGVPDAGTPDGGIVPPSPQLVFTGGGSTIRVFRFEADAGLSPLGSVSAGNGSSFLAPDLLRRRLYAVNESSSQVAAFTFESDAGLTFINRVSSGGNGPAHVSVDQTGALVFVANYGGGNTSVFPVTDAGLGAATQTLASGAQAHQIFADANNRFVYAPCKQADAIAQYVLDGGALAPLSPPTMPTAAGAGPRHLALHPTLPRAYLINELHSTVQTLAIDAQGRLTPLQTVSSLPSGFMGNNTGAEIAVHPNGRFVFASNRGHDSIASFSVDATSGELSSLGHTATGGNQPRHFSIDSTGLWLLVGNQSSGTVVLFAIDTQRGDLTSRGVVANVPNVAFAGFVHAVP